MTEQALRKETTSHPYIVINKDVCGGSPTIEGTRTRVMDIAIEYELLGRSPDEIIRSHPHVSLYQIHNALSFLRSFATTLSLMTLACTLSGQFNAPASYTYRRGLKRRFRIRNLR